MKKVRYAVFMALAALALATVYRVLHPPKVIRPKEAVNIVFRGHRASYVVPPTYAQDDLGTLLFFGWVFAIQIGVPLIWQTYSPSPRTPGRPPTWNS
jgi:hypothetical protein